MKTDRRLNKHVLGFFAIASLALLPSCKLLEWFKGKPSEQCKPAVAAPAMATAPAVVEEPVLTGDVIVSMQGKPLVTTDSLQAEKEKLIKAENPQLKAMMAFMGPEQFDRQLSEGLMIQAIVDKYIEDNKMNKSSEYQAELQEGYKAIGRMINAKYFSAAFEVSVSAADVKSFYDKNKDVMPNLLISRGGVAALGVQFENEVQANEFAAKVKQNNNDMKKTAQAAGLSDKVKDFKLIHSQSLGIDAALRDKIVGIKTVPRVEVFKIGDKSFWVVNAMSKQEHKYRPLVQVKNDIQQFLEKEKRSEQYDEQINRLKSEYGVVINEDHFKTEQPGAGQSGQSAINQQPKMAQKQAVKSTTSAKAKAKATLPKVAKAA